MKSMKSSAQSTLPNRLVSDVFLSLDGYAGGQDIPAYFGYAGEDLDKWVNAQLSASQTYLMGRKTFEIMASIVQIENNDMNRRMNELPKLVVSQTLNNADIWSNSEILGEDFANKIKVIKRSESPPLRTIGSLTLVRSLFDEGLIDRLRLIVFPIILGSKGQEPFFVGNFEKTHKLKLVETTQLDGRLILLEYEPH
jgi:dihydrofolate reductase